MVYDDNPIELLVKGYGQLMATKFQQEGIKNLLIDDSIDPLPDDILEMALRSEKIEEIRILTTRLISSYRWIGAKHAPHLLGYMEADFKELEELGQRVIELYDARVASK